MLRVGSKPVSTQERVIQTHIMDLAFPIFHTMRVLPSSNVSFTHTIWVLVDP